jgi:hypothetical protein
MTLLDGLDDWQVKEITRIFGGVRTPQSFESFYITGTKYLVRTVTMIYVGELKDQTKTELLFTNCSWIPETEYWSVTLKNGTFSEIEPYQDDVIVHRAAIVDSTVWKHDLPTERK